MPQSDRFLVGLALGSDREGSAHQPCVHSAMLCAIFNIQPGAVCNTPIPKHVPNNSAMNTVCLLPMQPHRACSTGITKVMHLPITSPLSPCTRQYYAVYTLCTSMCAVGNKSVQRPPTGAKTSHHYWSIIQWVDC